MGNVFLYEIDDIVYFVNGFSIAKGKVVGRKFVDAPAWQNPPSITRDGFNIFDMNGNRLGRSCELYEISFLDGTSNQNIVLDMSKLEDSPEGVVEKLLSSMKRLTQNKDDQK